MRPAPERRHDAGLRLRPHDDIESETTWLSERDPASSSPCDSLTDASEVRGSARREISTIAVKFLLSDFRGRD